MTTSPAEIREQLRGMALSLATGSGPLVEPSTFDASLDAYRAAVLHGAADRLAELRAAEREWLPATGLHKGEQELRRMADETATEHRCVCSHPADEHSVYGCEDDCACEWVPKWKPAAGARQDGAES
ncbi:hypothetical protein LUX34_23870 [Streptomyces werraensis]|nr:hypothetical protein [Streptomyces werraensis]